MKSIETLRDEDLPAIISRAWDRVRAAHGLPLTDHGAVYDCGWGKLAKPPKQPADPPSRQRRAKIPEEDIPIVLDRLRSGATYAMLAGEYGLSISRLGQIAREIGFGRAELIAARKLRKEARA